MRGAGSEPEYRRDRDAGERIFHCRCVSLRAGSIAGQAAAVQYLNPVTDILLVYITCADAEEARRIGRALVEERLAACVNIRPHEAIYRWQGAVEEGAETAMIAKTTRAGYPALQARVCALHSYRVPCIVALPAEAALGAYADWIAGSVG
ncbi:MAG: divalent-cation tolerance protein CutA [Acetobacteraceae bacterium]|nr:divalent-cation tolerance protein CutA [Acetobacteraceae bacterium]